MLDYNWVQYISIVWQSVFSLFDKTLLRKPYFFHWTNWTKPLVNISITYTKTTYQYVGHPMPFVDFSISITSAVNHCKFQQGTCEIGIKVCPGHRLSH